MAVHFDMYNFPRVQENWRKLKTCFASAYPNLDIKMVCRMTEALEVAGYKPFVTPCYDMQGCSGTKYSSFVLGRGRELPTDLKIAINDEASYSGAIAFNKWLDKKGLSASSIEVSGSHLNSVEMLLQNKVNLICVDCISFSYIQSELAGASTLNIIEQTPLVTGHPIVVQASEVQFDLSKMNIDPAILEGLRICDFAFV